MSISAQELVVIVGLVGIVGAVLVIAVAVAVRILQRNPEGSHKNHP